jgi:hypothetical protein
MFNENSNQCPYSTAEDEVILCRSCVENRNCRVDRKTRTACPWYDTLEDRELRKHRDRMLKGLAKNPDYASTMIDTINMVIFNESLDKGNPNDSRKSRVQISLGERECIMKTLKALIRVLKLKDKDYIGLVIYLNNVKESVK